ncbi:unnamed protein product [Oncorhynchus mykiss]|uniref:Alkylated DNA repair protein AlkB homologue 8 N-terminal domain-containing protein n=1 Tax=Oncorhynchus mykiss TaxID=8022 RepID=A0A060YX52_ONCMY|nr:unnamed protein product [Oncorhynchus mykiss]
MLGVCLSDKRSVYQTKASPCLFNSLCPIEMFYSEESLTFKIYYGKEDIGNRNQCLHHTYIGGGLCVCVCVRAVGVWCQENNISLKVNKTKEMIVHFRKLQMDHPPIHIDGTAVEKVKSFKFLRVHITDKLKWSTHTDNVVKKVQQKCGLAPKTLTNFYRCTIEGILLGSIMMLSAQLITGGKLQPPMSQEGQKDHQGQQSSRR